MEYNFKHIERALKLLDGRLGLNKSGHISIIICGGAALNAMRFDQIHFKLYAAIDQFGSYHAADLKQLSPSDDELLQAVLWAKSHDPSEGFQEAIKMFLREFGYEHLVDKI